MDFDNAFAPNSGELAPETVSNLRPRLAAMQRELARIFTELIAHRRRQTGVDGEDPKKALVQLSLQLAADEADPQLELYQQMKRAAEACADSTAHFPAGRVYCHWCRSFDCAHAFPSEPRSVFGGYTPTGQPVWPQLGSVLLDRRDPRVEEVFRESPTPLTLVQAGAELASDQLPVYGKRSTIYRILGQVALGYLASPRKSAPAHYSVTFQAVSAGDGRSPVRLNVLGRLEDGTPALEALEEASDPRLGDALRTARRRLGDIHVERVSRRRRSSERRRRALDVLHNLARNLDRIYRQRKRRTHHSERRHRNPRRPASTALRDALEARVESIFRDVEEKTWVVLGPKNRVHVFNDAGRHITSVVYPGETVRHRTTRGKWLAPPADQLQTFREALAAQTRRQDDAREESA